MIYFDFSYRPSMMQNRKIFTQTVTGKMYQIKIKSIRYYVTMIERIKTELNKLYVEEAISVRNALQDKGNESCKSGTFKWRLTPASHKCNYISFGRIPA